jgi:Tfp pilus assembly protein PilO
MLIINILILFFILLIGYQILIRQTMEGMTNATETTNNAAATYKQYNNNPPSDALILAQQNAGNIEYIKQRMDTIQGMDKQIQDLSGNVQELQKNMNDLITANQQYTKQMIGSTPPEITGINNEST